MPAALINPTLQLVDEPSETVMSVLQVFATATPGHYTLASRGRRVAGALLARPGGGYILTIGPTVGDGTAIKTSAGVIIF